MLRKNDIFRDRTHPFDITHPFDTDIRWWIHFQEVQIQMRRYCDHNRPRWEGHSDQQSDRFLKLTPLLQVSLVKRYVCGELIGVGQDRPVQSLPFICRANLVASQSSYTRVLASSGVVSKMCVASWSGWFRTALFRALRLSVRLTFCGTRFAVPLWFSQ